jgi:hypothetical protein
MVLTLRASYQLLREAKSEYTVAYLLRAKTVEPEKQPLLANGSETTFVSRQLLGKHIPAATGMNTIIQVLLETVFSIRSVQRVIRKTNGATK